MSITKNGARFRSLTPNLNVYIPAVKNGVAFRDHVYETADPAVATQLRGHAGCGSDFHEESAAVQAEIKKVADEAGIGEGKKDDAKKDGDKKKSS